MPLPTWLQIKNCAERAAVLAKKVPLPSKAQVRGCAGRAVTLAKKIPLPSGAQLKGCADKCAKRMSFKSDDDRRVENDIAMRQQVREMRRLVTKQGREAGSVISQIRDAKTDPDRVTVLRGTLKRILTSQRTFESQLLRVEHMMVVGQQVVSMADFTDTMRTISRQVATLEVDTAGMTAAHDAVAIQSERMQDGMDALVETTCEDVAPLSDEEVDAMIEPTVLVEQKETAEPVANKEIEDSVREAEPAMAGV